MYETSDIRNGLKIEIDGEPFIVVDFQFVKPGKGNAFTRTRIKSMTTGRVIDRTYKSGESLQRANLESRNMQYLYSDGTDYTFMDNSSYEQLEISGEALGDTTKWLIENLDVEVLLHNERPINVELPIFVDIKIAHCEPGVKGNTATGATKPATLSTGAIVYVPLFINEGEAIRIDTRKGEYVSRAKS
jgi:elongation factor P